MLPHPGSILTAALVVALAAIPPASPDDGPLPARRQGAVVSGVVWDSTAGRPLSGATVLVSGSGESAVSDEAGRFVVRGVAPGTQSVAAFHAVFDSLGFAALRTVELSEGDSASVVVASPSFETLWGAVCGDAPMSGPTAGILFGTVRDADTGAGIGAAGASLTWIRVDTAAGRIRADNVGVDLRTDDAGAYYACGVDVGREVTLAASVDGARSADLTTVVGARRVARLDVSIDRATTNASESAAAAMGTARVGGTVRSDAGAPVREGTVRLLGTDREVRTDSAGRFVLRDLPAGSRTLEVIALGYEPVREVVHLRSADSTGANVVMRRANVLPAVEVREQFMARALRGMEERKKMGFGKYMTGEEIQKFPTLRTAFASLPNVHITTANRLMVSDWAVSGPGLLSGTCPMNVLIDGRFTTWEEAREIPQRLIAAIEVYPRTNSGPFEMLPPSARGCGIFLIWTNR